MDTKNYEKRLENIRFVAKVYGWQETRHDKYNCHLRFQKKGMIMNIYYTKMTVGTALEHPTLGKTQLFRKHVSMDLLEKLFENPRHHTDKGYMKKNVNNLGRWYK